MDASFWHDRWETNRIGFHQPDANPLLVEYIDALSLEPGNRVFIPLCGKTRDIAWLLSQGYAVAGAELSELAIEQLFEELDVTPTVKALGDMKHYSAPNLDIFVGDVFELTAEVLGPVDAIYDRAAIVALPEQMRTRYTAHMREITAHAAQLIICFEYDQSLMDGPPFSVNEEELRRHYDDAYTPTLLMREEMDGGLKGFFAMEMVWHLIAR